MYTTSSYGTTNILKFDGFHTNFTDLLHWPSKAVVKEGVRRIHHVKHVRSLYIWSCLRILFLLFSISHSSPDPAPCWSSHGIGLSPSPSPDVLSAGTRSSELAAFSLQGACAVEPAQHVARLPAPCVERQAPPAAPCPQPQSCPTGSRAGDPVSCESESPAGPGTRRQVWSPGGSGGCGAQGSGAPEGCCPPAGSLRELDNEKAQRLQLLEVRNTGISEVHRWINQNKDQFRGQVRAAPGAGSIPPCASLPPLLGMQTPSNTCRSTFFPSKLLQRMQQCNWQLWSSMSSSYEPWQLRDSGCSCFEPESN